MTRLRPSRALIAGCLLAGGWIMAQTARGVAAVKVQHPSILLVTLDTTRADALGCYGGSAAASTPHLDAVAARGVRFARAIAPAPLTLPAHTSILTGLYPPQHGVRENGTQHLSREIPTLAAALSEAGYATAAFVGSRILDARFGLARGFEHYRDRMTAEQVGQYGYPERDAAAVTNAALEWLEAHGDGPSFLWVHYYDPHAPYVRGGGAPDSRESYLAEVEYVDAQLGRLLAALPNGGEDTLIAVVGDHGEMLGAHGEERHGIFLYTEALHVPLLLAGPGVSSGTVVFAPVSTRALAASMLRLAGLPKRAQAFGDPLAGLFPVEAQPIYSETLFPAYTFGWSPLFGVTTEGYRYIEAPQPELYDLEKDPRESHNLVRAEPERAKRLAQQLESWHAKWGAAASQAARVDPALRRAIESLGYLSPSGGSRPGTLDPKVGITLLDTFHRAKQAMVAREIAAARTLLETLVAKSPDSVPFLSNLAKVQFAGGDVRKGLATLRRALELNPQNQFVRLTMADALARTGQTEEAIRQLREALRLNPRFSQASIRLAQIHAMAGDGEAARGILERSLEAGSASATVNALLGRMELERGEAEAAEARLAEAVRLLPGSAHAWAWWGEAARVARRTEEARRRFERALELDPRDARALLGVGQLLLAAGRSEEARIYLARAVQAGGSTSAAREARELLERE